MHGLSPRDYSLTPRQIQISTEVSRSVPALPVTLTDLISQMALSDFSLALRPLELNEDGEVIQNQNNLDISAVIELALTSSSTDCSPLIKAQIFINATELIDIRICAPDQYGGLLRNYLAQIIKEVQEKGEQINLDDIVLNDLDMSRTMVRFDLSGMSARRATFNNVNMKHLTLTKADLTGAILSNSSLEQANNSNAIVTGATFTNVSFRNTVVSELTGNQSSIFEASATCSEFTILRGVMIARAQSTYLSGIHVTAVPDTDRYTLPAQKIIIPVQNSP